MSDVLKNFLEAYLLDQNRFFKLVYDFPVAKGKLSKIFASNLDEKSRIYWMNEISDIRKENPSWNWSVYDFDKFISHLSFEKIEKSVLAAEIEKALIGIYEINTDNISLFANSIKILCFEKMEQRAYVTKAELDFQIQSVKIDISKGPQNPAHSWIRKLDYSRPGLDGGRDFYEGKKATPADITSGLPVKRQNLEKDVINSICENTVSSIVTLEEAGRSWVFIVKDKLKRKKIDINDWDSDNSLVQLCLDKFKTGIGDKYKDHIFSEKEIQEIIQGFFEQNRILGIGIEEKKQINEIIEKILYAYNEHTKSLMSNGERTLHNMLSSDFDMIMDKLGKIEKQPVKENIKKFLRAIEVSKEIELENIEDLINGEYEIDRSEIIETIQAERERLISIQGNAGSGKSVVCKKLLNGKEYVLVTRAENLSTGRKADDLWDCDIEDAIIWLENKPLYIFIDAIEFIADCGNNAFRVLQEIYRLADKYNNVYIITSCRTTDSSAFIKINTKYKIKTYEIPDLTKDEIDKVAKEYPIILSLQQNKKYSDTSCHKG